MRIFAISDLHLCVSGEKPMDIFGSRWQNYVEKIREDWLKKVSPEDIVLIAGDISWAMSLDVAEKDIRSTLSDLPGKKVMIRGNHDYWWSGIGKIRERMPQSDNFFFLQNDCLRFDGVVLCGSRGWAVEGSPDFKEQDRKIYLREEERLKLAFSKVEKEKQEGDELICLVHYPPFNVHRENSLFTEIFEKFSVDKVVYGHLHGKESRADLLLEKNGIKYYLTSCDQVDNKLQLISETKEKA